jgi:hypothetical protein
MAANWRDRRRKHAVQAAKTSEDFGRENQCTPAIQRVNPVVLRFLLGLPPGRVLLDYGSRCQNDHQVVSLSDACNYSTSTFNARNKLRPPLRLSLVALDAARRFIITAITVDIIIPRQKRNNKQEQVESHALDINSPTVFFSLFTERL